MILAQTLHVCREGKLASLCANAALGIMLQVRWTNPQCGQHHHILA